MKNDAWQPGQRPEIITTVISMMEASMTWVKRKWPMSRTGSHANTTWEVSIHHRTSPTTCSYGTIMNIKKNYEHKAQNLPMPDNLFHRTYVHKTRNMFHCTDTINMGGQNSPGCIHVRGLRRTQSYDATTSVDKLYMKETSKLSTNKLHHYAGVINFKIFVFHETVPCP